MDLRNSNGFHQGTFTLQPYRSFLSNIFIRSGKMHHVELSSGIPNQVSKTSFYTFEDADLRESHAKLHKNRVKLWEQIEFKG